MLGKREDYEYIQWSNCHLIELDKSEVAEARLRWR